MKKIISFFLDAWQPALLAIVALCLCVAIYFFRIGSLTNGYSTAEIRSVASASSGIKIIKNPVDLPHKLGQYALWKMNYTSVGAMRSISVVFAIISIVLFYYIITTWHTSRVASLTTLIFALSSWLLHVGRSATPDVLLVFLPLLLVASGIYIRRAPRGVFALHLGAFVAAISLYIPLGAVFIVPILISRIRPFLKGVGKPALWMQLTSISLFVLVSAPLIYALARDPGIIRNLLLLPSSDVTLQAFWQTFVSSILSLMIQAVDLAPDLWLNNISILDAGSAVLLLLGIYAYSSWFRLQRTKIFFVALLAGLVFTGISSSVSTIGVVIPIIYLLIGGGITYLLKEWFFVFPRNPIARNLGGSLISILVLLIAFYHANHYFIAWPLSSSTQSAFTSRSDLLE